MATDQMLRDALRDNERLQAELARVVKVLRDAAGPLRSSYQGEFVERVFEVLEDYPESKGNSDG